jgi:predicted O-methyltransferase YrrM
MRPNSFLNVPGHLYDVEGLFLEGWARDKWVLEVGTHHGRSAVALARFAKGVVTVDHFLGDNQIDAPKKELTLLHLEKHENITLLDNDWKKLCLDFKQFDCIFYDGDHTQEKEFLSQLLDFPGRIAIHDYKLWDKGMSHVIEAVDWYSRESGRPMRIGPGSIIWFSEL